MLNNLEQYNDRWPALSLQ